MKITDKKEIKNMKKISNDLDSIESIMIDTELNKWIKKLNAPQKKIFFMRLWSNDLLWLGRDLKERKLNFNNYRYVGQGKPLDINKILIFITAVYADPMLKITEIFPDISPEYSDPDFSLIKVLAQRSFETDNFNRGYVKNKKKQLAY